MFFNFLYTFRIPNRINTNELSSLFHFIFRLVYPKIKTNELDQPTRNRAKYC